MGWSFDEDTTFNVFADAWWDSEQLQKPSRLDGEQLKQRLDANKPPWSNKTDIALPSIMSRSSGGIRWYAP